MDIKAAFDSVNVSMLSKSMERLKIPSDFIHLTQDILTNRSCQILTPHGPTNHIPIQDGIPQGETISPLWWIIFYDPLLTKLNKQKNKPYNLSNNLAYMDDLNLISTSQQNTQILLNITSQFLSINNIDINPKKTKLLTINPLKKTTLSITLNTYSSNILQPTSQSIITPNGKNDPIRILGIYLSENSILKPGRSKIQENISIVTQSLKSKYTTGPITSYIYNTVLLPRIEYHLQTTYLTNNQTISYQRIINSTLKHKYSIEKTLSNKWFYNPYFFNIKPISNLQQEVLISNLQYKLADPIINPYINLELSSIQKTNCIPTCIFTNPSLPFSSSTNLFSIQIAKLLNITFCTPQQCTHQIQIPNSKTPLYNFFSSSQLKKFAFQLYKKNLYYIEQLTSHLDNTLIKWHHLSHITGKIQRGKTPLWYKTLLKHPLLPPGNPHIINNKKRKYIAFTNNDDILFGKKQKTTDKTHIIINHLSYDPNKSHDSLTLYPCKGCNLNTHNTPDKCKLSINTNQSFNLFTKKTHNNLISTRISKHNLFNHLSNNLPTNTLINQTTNNILPPLLQSTFSLLKILLFHKTSPPNPYPLLFTIQFQFFLMISNS